MQTAGILLSILWVPGPDISESEARDFLRAVRGDEPARVVAMVEGNRALRFVREVPSRRTPLHLAVYNPNPAILACLLRYYKNPNFFDRGGLSPLHDAALHGEVNYLKMLLAHGAIADPVCRMNDLSSETMRASPLALAAMRGSVDAVQLLLEHGADPNGLYPKLMHGTPAVMSSDPLWPSRRKMALNRGNEKVLRILKDAGADLNGKGAFGDFPLLNAVDKRRPDVVRALLALKVNVNQTTSSGDTVFSILIQRNHPADLKDEAKRRAVMEIASLLVKAGIDVDRRDNTGKDAAAYAKWGRNEWLLRYALSHKKEPKSDHVETEAEY